MRLCFLLDAELLCQDAELGSRLHFDRIGAFLFARRDTLALRLASYFLDHKRLKNIEDDANPTGLINYRLGKLVMAKESKLEEIRR